MKYTTDGQLPARTSGPVSAGKKQSLTWPGHLQASGRLMGAEAKAPLSLQ